MLQGKNALKIGALARNKGTASLDGGHTPVPPVVRQPDLSQEAISCSVIPNPVALKLLWQASLPGAKESFDSTPGLWRISWDQLNPKLSQGTLDLGRVSGLLQPVRTASLACCDEVAPLIGVEATEGAVSLDDAAQLSQDATGVFLRHEDSIIDLRCGIIQDDKQVLLGSMWRRPPGVGAGILKKKHPRQGPARSALPMSATLAPFSNKPSTLQSFLDPAVAQPDSMVAPDLLSKMRSVPAAVALTVE